MENVTTLVRGGRDSLDAGTSRRESLEGSALERRAETSAAAQAEMARAHVLARFQMARMNPRDQDHARLVLLKECRRPGFADVARYAKPVGKQKIYGASVRFAEAALRTFGNMSIDTPTIFDDAEKRIVRVYATDLETNATLSADVTVVKTVERKALKDGQKPIGIRQNSYGDTVYIVEATDDEVMQKAGALISKARRNLILQLIPGDIVEECMEQVVKTQEDRDAEDPDAARKRMVDSFFELGVSPAALKEYLGHDIGASTKAELTNLRAVFASLRAGEATWQEIMSKTAGDEERPATVTDRARAAAKASVAKTRAPVDPKTHDAATGEARPDLGEVSASDEPPPKS
jgi:hypothetical protein